jgi:hypothetical protein
MTSHATRFLGAASLACFFAELQAPAGLKDRVHFLKTPLEPLLLAGWIGRTIPDKLHSSKRKYRLREKGRKVLHEQAGGEK